MQPATGQFFDFFAVPRILELTSTTCRLHLQTVSNRRKGFFTRDNFPNAEAYAKEAISIPLYFGLNQ